MSNQSTQMIFAEIFRYPVAEMWRMCRSVISGDKIRSADGVDSELIPFMLCQISC